MTPCDTVRIDPDFVRMVSYDTARHKGHVLCTTPQVCLSLSLGMWLFHYCIKGILRYVYMNSGFCVRSVSHNAARHTDRISSNRVARRCATRSDAKTTVSVSRPLPRGWGAAVAQR
jgi:hypothetical protein